MGRARLVFCLVAFATAGLTLLAGSAAAVNDQPAEGLTCSFDPGTRTLTVTVGSFVDSGGKIERLGDQIAVLVDDLSLARTRKGKIRPHRTVTFESCGATPTVHNTDTIRVLMDTDEDTDFRISLAGGPLAPGATPEADSSSEIEISVEHLAPGLSVGFIGGPEADLFRFGSAAGAPGVNLNAQTEETSPDIDATLALDSRSDPNLANADWPVLEAFTEAGDDAVTSAGGTEFDGAFGGAVEVNGGSGNDRLISSSPRFTFIKGAAGSDFIQGSGLRNVVFGGGGPDTIVTGPRGDDVEPGKGRDVAFLGGGFDLVAAHDRTGDRINCGGNRDAISKDRKDRTPSCERKTFEPFHLKPFDH
jgi:hypothetical protein